jgi:hypothetical protein
MHRNAQRCAVIYNVANTLNMVKMKFMELFSELQCVRIICRLNLEGAQSIHIPCVGSPAADTLLAGNMRAHTVFWALRCHPRNLKSLYKIYDK